MRVLLTRPSGDTKALGDELEAIGYEVISSPLLGFEPLKTKIDFDNVGALIFTSRYSVRAAADGVPDSLKSLPVFAVGSRTAMAAKEAGFGNVITGPGRAALLPAVISGFPGGILGRILHLSGEEVSVDVAALCRKRGFEAARCPVYRMTASRAFTGEAGRALSAGEIGAVLFFSPRTADIFVSLIRKAKLEAKLGGATAIALSQKVASRLQPLDWGEMVVASHPDRAAMIEALRGLNTGNRETE